MWPALHPQDAARVAAGKLVLQAANEGLNLQHATALLAHARQHPALTGAGGVTALLPDSLAWPAVAVVEGRVHLREAQRQIRRYDAFNPEHATVGAIIPNAHMDEMNRLLLTTLDAVQAAGRVLLARAAEGTLLRATRDEGLFCAAALYVSDEAEWLASRPRLTPSLQRGSGYRTALNVGALVVVCWREAQTNGFDCRDENCIARGSTCERALSWANAYDFFAPHVLLALDAVRNVGRAHDHNQEQEAALLDGLDALLPTPSRLRVPLTQSFRDAVGPRAVRDALLADGGAVLAVLRNAAQAMDAETDRKTRQQLRRQLPGRRRCAAPACSKQEAYRVQEVLRVLGRRLLLARLPEAALARRAQARVRRGARRHCRRRCVTHGCAR